MTYQSNAPQPASGPAVLVVEDDTTTAFVLQKVLQRAGYDVKTAGSCNQAINTVREHAFDVLISDLSLPDGHGHDLLVQIQSIQPAIKGIALSGHGGESDIRNSYEAGFAEHLVKPVDLSMLEAAIGRVTGETANT